MDLNNICADILNIVIDEFKKDENQQNIKYNVLDPSIKYIVNQLYPYIITTCIIFILTFLLAIAIFVLLIRENFKLKLSPNIIS